VRGGWRTVGCKVKDVVTLESEGEDYTGLGWDRVERWEVVVKTV